MEEAQARGNLRHALSRIKQAAPSAVRAGLLFEGANVSLDPSVVDVDVARFERLVADGTLDALRQVAEVYRGDLLAGMVLDERPFEQWLSAERERLHELAIQGFARLLSHEQQAGDARAAVQTGLRLLALDPLQEPVHRAVMRLYTRLGRREAALRQYQICVEALARELDTQPASETTELYQQIVRSRTPHADYLEPEPRDDRPSVMVSADAGPPNNLPAPTAELIGRRAALTEVKELLAVHQLVTLIGVGGIGKTELALEVARQLLPEFGGGAWVADLAPLSDPALVPITVALALRLTIPAGAASAESVASRLGSRRVLIVLDNCEHVIEAAAGMADALLRGNAEVRVLATSSEALRVPGERVYAVSPLEVPPDTTQDEGDVLEAAAVKLFRARAEAVGFRVSSDARTAALVGAVCRRLDGIPLAIELAAARTATLGVEGIAARLDDRFRLLTGGHRTALPRHQTLRAALDWNYELLAPLERTVLHRLAMFVGGFALEAATAVATVGDLDAADVVNSVASLAEKSLVVVETNGGVTRYRMLETTRVYAHDKLSASGELDDVARRHAEYCRELFERAEVELDVRSAADWLASYGSQIDNARRALDWTFSPRGDAALGATLVAATVPLWVHLSLMTECRSRVERALAARGQIPPDVRRDMRLFLALGTALWHTRGVGHPDMPAALTKALDLAEQLGDTEYRLRATFALYVFRFITGDYRAALVIAEQLIRVADQASRATDGLIASRLIGAVLHILGDQAAARRRIEPMLDADFATARRAHIVRYQYDQHVVTHSYYARILWLQGFADQAMRVTERVVDYARAGDHLTSLLFALIEAACPLAFYTGDLARSERFVGLIRELSVKHGLEAWNVWAECFDSVTVIKRGDAPAGSRRLQAALRGLPEAAFHFHYTAFLAELAEGLSSAGQVTESIVLIEDTLRRADQREERWLLAELLRKKGELVLRTGAETAEAEDDFTQALDVARRQGALAWELRTAMSLAQLWRRHGKPSQARTLLESVYRRFTEGLDTADLVVAKTLLQSLQ
jgi:predicted ATPase